LRILGIDPGLSRMGYGVIEVSKAPPIYVASGTITSRTSDPITERIGSHYIKLQAIIETHNISMLSMEKIFVKLNPATALKLGYVRGIVLLLASQFKLKCHEYAAREIKNGITGYGAAGKEQVQKMVCMTLNIPEMKYSDESDALAIALYYAQQHRFRSAVSKAEMRG
jgi:crossover junction endodeoxyribonuclease RuvC